MFMAPPRADRRGIFMRRHSGRNREIGLIVVLRAFEHHPVLRPVQYGVFMPSYFMKIFAVIISFKAVLGRPNVILFAKSAFSQYSRP